MAKELEELPLFPLNMVLFPYASARLHIFEDRYREMIRRCLEFDRPFGIVLIRSGNEIDTHVDPYMVGTAVRIDDVYTYDDGRMDIKIEGTQRFRIRELDESRSYLVGKVEPVLEHEIEESDRATELMTRAREDFEVLVQRLFSNFSVQVVFPTDPVTLSFTIANMLQMENLEKQKILEITDTLERMEDLLPIIQTQILQFQQSTRYRVTGADLKDWISPN